MASGQRWRLKINKMFLAVSPVTEILYLDAGKCRNVNSYVVLKFVNVRKHGMLMCLEATFSKFLPIQASTKTSVSVNYNNL